jgi:hemerythrin-like metal-binding protein
MANLTWKRNYSVGVKALDTQHTVLLEILNDLSGVMTKGQAQSLTGSLLRNLVEYARNHFSAEEAILADAGYAGLDDHKDKHRDLIQQVEEYVAGFERGENMLNLHLLHLLHDWFTSHILKVDQEYGSWLNEHGVR